MNESFLSLIISSIPQEGLLLAIAIAVIVLIQTAKPRRSRSSWANRDRAQPVPASDLSQPANQMDAIAEIGFQRRPLLNATEYRIFATVENALKKNKFEYRVMAQTSLGEVLRTEGAFDDASARRAFSAINSKRLDVAIFDRAGMLVLAIEVQGSGHHLKKTTFMRDAVKREALRRAGVEMLEVTPDWDQPRIEVELSRRLNLKVVA